MNKIKDFFRFCMLHKFKVVVALLSFLVCGFLLFPIDDLGDLVSVQVANNTNKQVYLQFDHLNLSLLDFGVSFGNISVETPLTPPLSAEELTLSPSLMSLIRQKPGGSVSAKGFMNGNINISLTPSGKTEAGTEKHAITISAQSLSLEKLRDVLQLPLAMKGKLNIQSNATADFTLKEQPDVELEVKIDQLELPPSNVQTNFGPLTLPELKLSQVLLKGRLSAGKFLITEGTLGKDSDELFGSIKGDMDLALRNENGFAPVLGAYNFTIDLNAQKSFQDKASLFLGFLDTYKSVNGDRARYQFKMSGTNFQNPSLGPAR